MNQRSMAKRYFFVTLIVSFIYAFVRYYIFKEVSHTKIPLWITNKATSLASTILIVTSVIWSPDKPRKTIGLLGLFVGILHSWMSVALLSPEYYSKFYIDSNIMTTSGELTMLCGVLTLGILFMAGFHSFPALTEKEEVDLPLINKLVLWGIFLNLLHLGFMGFSGWLDVSHWPGYLPPVSLVAAFFCVWGICQKLLKSK